MNEVIVTASRGLKDLITHPVRLLRALSRVGLLLFVIALMLISPEDLREAITASLADAYIQVTIFVAATLLVVYLLERAFAFDLGHLLAKSNRRQPLYAALLGALPGCGGAIVVMTHYTKGYITFGSVVSVLIATMGDAAFLLIAREPQTGLLVIAISVVTGTISGFIVDWTHGTNYLRAKVTDEVEVEHPGSGPTNALAAINTGLGKLWLLMLIPGVPLALGGAFQIDTNAWFGSLASLDPVLYFGVFGAFISIYLWSFRGRLLFETEEEHAREPMIARLVEDTCFVTSWVVMAFIGFELLVYFADTSLQSWFSVWAPLVPLIALIIGFIPGCGPQIVVTSMYLAGIIPFSAQLTNAIANDGDALFPAIALAPKAAIHATLYSALPALLIGYGWFFLFE